MTGFFEAAPSTGSASDKSKSPSAERPSGRNDRQTLADSLLQDASVKECAVVERYTRSDDSSELVAYVVTADPSQFDRIEPRLRSLSGGRIASFVPLFRLPVTDQGQIDLAALAQIPVWSDDLAAACEGRVAALPDIDRVACVLEYRKDAPRHVHVGSLLQEVLPGAPGPRRGELPSLAVAVERSAGSAPPSMRQGGALPPRRDAAQVLPDLLQRAPQDTPIVYVDADGAELSKDYGALLEEARRLLCGLRRHGLRPGDKVVLQLDLNSDILPAFWGCLFGGFQPVIVPVPLAYNTESRALDHLVHVWNLFDRPLTVTTGSRLKAIGEARLTEARLAAIEELRDNAPDPHVHAAAPDDVAFFTLSSGSTGLPKAVMLTHRNILSRARGTSLLCGQSADDVILNWLPFDHIGSISDWHLRCVELGCALVYAPKEYVLGRPLRWLDLMHRHRVTHSWAPNFAYSLVSAALKGEERREWDLSPVRMLLTAGESITRSTTQEFLDCLSPYGLQPSTLQTAFGMAEVGSGVTYHLPAPGQSLTFHHVDRNSLGGTLLPVASTDSTAVSFASLGHVIPSMSMRIVDDEQRVVPEGTTGHLQFSGDAVSPGYYNNPEANVVFLASGWFDTGDIGFISDGELMLTGRADAGIIINGANFYSNEIEAVVEQVDGVTESFTAACAVRPADGDAQKLALFFSTPFDDDAVLRKLLRAIQLRLTKQLGIRADYLIPIEEAAVPKTGIGKIQRKRLTDQFQKGAFQEVLERLDVLAGSGQTLPDRFYRRVWHRRDLVHGTRPPHGSCLVLGSGREMVALLSGLGVSCVTVEAGGALRQHGPQAWTIRPGEPQDYRALFQALADAGEEPRSIVHLFNYGAAGGESASASIAALAEALATLPGSPAVRLLTVSRGSQAIDSREACTSAPAPLPGLLNSICQELPWLQSVHVDLRPDAGDGDASLLVSELLTPSPDREVAYRGGERWVPGLRRIDIAARTDAAAWNNPLRRHGVYVLNNGLEGLGPHLAEVLLQQFDAHVLLLGKDRLPIGDGEPRADLADRIATYDRLCEPGGKCTYAVADPQDPAALQQAMETCLARWGGALDGVIHLPAANHGSRPAAFDDDATAVAALSGIARARDCAFVVLSSVANFPGAGAACAPGPQVYRIGLAGLEEPGTAAAARQSINSLLVGLRLSEPELLIGLDDTDPAVRARLLDGPVQSRTPAICFTARRMMSRDDLRAAPVTDRYGTTVECDYLQMREGESAAAGQIELWPSVAEYFVYDDLIYYALANDERRNQKYREALERTAPGKIVLDIGTGKEAILARLALEAGARKVYAIEKGDEAFAQAVAHIEKLGLQDRITIIHGDAATAKLPEPADVCVSEIVGPIGGCEGAAVVINDAHRFLGPDGVMIPVRSETRIAAVRLPDALTAHPGFYRVPASYAEKIFAEVGYPFDLRVCIKKFPATHLLSNAAIFEDLDFSRVVPLEQQHDIELFIEQESRFDGFLVWLNLHTIAGTVIDILEHEHSWLPVYLPVFDPGIDVRRGDRIRATVSRTLCDNGHNPDYVVAGTLIRATGETIAFTHASYHHARRFKQNPFYERLFREDAFGRRPGCRPGNALQYLPEMPLTATGEIDGPRLRLLVHGQDETSAPRQVPASEIELKIARVWQDVLGVAEVGIHDNFFELGGHSLLLVQAHNRLTELFGPGLTLVDLFNYPTIHALVQALRSDAPHSAGSQTGAERAKARKRGYGTGGDTAVAVIGLACRFPGADTPDAFWRNLAAGTESITFFTEQEVIASGVDPAVARNPAYVRASPILSDIEDFDAEFFGYGPQDAALMDPQQRLLLECAWEALENAGYDPFRYPGAIGVYAGASMNTYLLNNVYPNRDTLDTLDSLDVTTLDSMGGFQLMVANDKDYLPTRLSYKLNLRGPSINVQTACSTGLVAIHLACQSLLSGEADMFLAAGSSVQVPHRAGHLYQEGMIVSPDGHCRAFDAKAKGTVFGSGVGVVVLKRLEDAVRDGDHIFSVIKGSAVNNDGGMKVGYMAPSSEGQAAVVAEALAVADVPPETIGFVEAHGTGTEMGDPIEVNALTQAYRAQTGQDGFCAIGSVKTNVGHLQIASGMVGFIKSVLAVRHGMIPPSLHFEAPNPAIDFGNSPFYVATNLTPWKTDGLPRRAGVNSLGIGGTNAHVILEEAPAIAATENGSERSRHLLLLSARNETALGELAGRYGAFLADNPDASLADLCFTANTGRRQFDHRLAIVAESVGQLRDDLRGVAAGEDRAIRGRVSNSRGRGPLAFLFTGQGSQYVGMGQELYQTQPSFRRNMDRCAEILQGLLDRPLLDVLYRADSEASELHETLYTQPALFAVEYALAELWKSWGISPAVVMGHSLGEYVAACIAGVFSLEDALKLVAARGRLMQALPEDGTMAAVFAGVDAVEPFVTPVVHDAAIAGENGPSHTVISGRTKAIEEICARLQDEGIVTRTLKTSHAFHSPLMQPMLGDFARIAGQIAYAEPRIEIVSNVTGELIGDEIATAEYWCRHIRQPVRFFAGMKAMAALGCDTFIEIGPKPTLLGLGAGCVDSESVTWLPSLSEHQPDWQQLLHSVARLAVGGPVDWMGFEEDYRRCRVPLPTYPFQRQRYWLDRPARSARQEAAHRSGRAASPLLGSRLRLPALQTAIYQNQLDAQALPLLSDHRIFGEMIVSAACHVALLLTAARQTFGDAGCVLKDAYFLQPLIVPDGQSSIVQTVLSPGADATSAQVISFAAATSDGDDEPNASVHVEASMHRGSAATQSAGEAKEAVWRRCRTELSVEEFFQAQAERRIELGPSYRWIKTLRLGDGEAVCDVAPPAALGGLDAGPLHPGILDAGFGLLLAAAPLRPEDTWMPFSIAEVRLHRDPDPERCWAHLTLREAGDANRVVADVRLCDEQGRAWLEFIGLEARRVSRAEILRQLPGTSRRLLYQKRWQPLAAPASRVPTAASTQWLIFADAQGIGDRLAQHLRRDGARCVVVTPGDAFGTEDPDRYRLNPMFTANFDRLFREGADRVVRYDGVVHLWSLDEPAPDTARWLSNTQSLACASGLHLVQAIARTGAVDPGRLWLVTRGAQATDGDSSVPQIQQMPSWGLGQTIALEHPELQCTCIDLDPTADAADGADDLLEAIRTADEEPELAWRQGVRHVARLTAQSDAIANDDVPVDAAATYLITGGTGGLGLCTAEWLVAQGARHLLLVSRHPPSPAATDVIDRLQRSGASVQMMQADVADRDALDVAFEATRAQMPPLRGVIHAAGLIDDGMLFEQEWRRFRSVFRAKIDGAWNLHKLTEDSHLDFFVLFSSAASVLGSQGQANYAAANAFLDGLAHYRKANGLPATSVNWGPWDQIGIAASKPAIKDRMNRQGFAGIHPDDGLSLLGRIVRSGATQVSAIDCDWRTYLAQLAKPGSLFSELRIADRPAADESRPATASAVMPQLRQASRADRRQLLSDLVHGAVRRVLGMRDGAPLEDGRPLTEQGLDSLMAVQLRNSLANSLGQPLPVSLVFNYPTMADIIDYLDEQLAEGEDAPASDHNEAGEQARQRIGSATRAAHELLADLDALLAEEAPADGDG